VADAPLAIVADRLIDGTGRDPIEAARGYRQLIDEFAFSQEDLAGRVGRARSTVANTLRLLELKRINLERLSE